MVFAHSASSRHLAALLFLVLATILAALPCAAQTQAEVGVQDPVITYIQTHPELVTAWARFAERLTHDLHAPPPRADSVLLPLLPESTMGYLAIPNYGDVTRQFLDLFHQQLADKAFREWWQQDKVSGPGKKVELGLTTFMQLSEYLGPEIVVAHWQDGKKPEFALLAALRKPGLKDFILQLTAQHGGKWTEGLRVYEPRELAEVKSAGDAIYILVRPDVVIVTPDFASVKEFNARLENHSSAFASTAFARRIAKDYVGGVTSIVAADLQAYIRLAPPASLPSLQRTGFSNADYFVARRSFAGGSPVNEADLSFAGPRRSAAAWLASPSPLAALDFASPAPIALLDLKLAGLPHIFDQIKEWSGPTDRGFATLAGFERGFHVSLREDILASLGGEIMAEFIAPPDPPRGPEWRVALQASDAPRIESTLLTIFDATHLPVEKSSTAGFPSYSVVIPSESAAPVPFAFVDGYWLMASSQDRLAEAVRFHRQGGSMAKSKSFLDSLPSGREPAASGLFYQDPVRMYAIRARALSPSLAGFLDRAAGGKNLLEWAFYGEDSALRVTARGSAYDMLPVVLIGAAIAIPNFLRARVAANQASAVGTLRAIVTAQVTYATTYPQKGFAPDLATLGPGSGGPADATADHASLLDERLAAAECKAGHWCTGSGYRWLVAALCAKAPCDEFVAVATPISEKDGNDSYCATSDGIIRVKRDQIISSPIGVPECHTWPPLQ